jgi:TPP-dependent pyruvate/acetoin dehydrogenase alpha subunit
MRLRFEAFGIAVQEIDSTDVDEISPVAGRAVDHVRATGSPCALIIHTYRLCHHSKNDDSRPREEVEARMALDPLKLHAERLDPDAVDALDEQVGAAIEALVTELTEA